MSLLHHHRPTSIAVPSYGTTSAQDDGVRDPNPLAGLAVAPGFHRQDPEEVGCEVHPPPRPHVGALESPDGTGVVFFFFHQRKFQHLRATKGSKIEGYASIYGNDRKFQHLRGSKEFVMGVVVHREAAGRQGSVCRIRVGESKAAS